MEIVDLSIVINEDTPVYPGDPKISLQLAQSHDSGFCIHELKILTHSGTHIDAPYHVDKSGKKLDEFEIDRFVGKGVLIEPNRGKFDLEAAKNVEIKSGDIVLLKTDLSTNMSDKDYFTRVPEIREDFARYLIDCKVSVIGIDNWSTDSGEFKIHKIILGSEVLLIENLVNLDKLVGKSFKIYALPLKLELDGAPARVIAEIL